MHAPQIHRRLKADKTTPFTRKGSCKQRHTATTPHAQQNESQITRICAKTWSRGLGRSMTSVEKKGGKVGSAARNSICLTFMYATDCHVGRCLQHTDDFAVLIWLDTRLLRYIYQRHVRFTGRNLRSRWQASQTRPSSGKWYPSPLHHSRHWPSALTPTRHAQG